MAKEIIVATILNANSLDELQQLYASYIAANEDITKKLAGLTLARIADDYSRIEKFGVGYAEIVKDNNTVAYLHMRGIEIYTNAACDIARCGFNGEDHAVFIHFTVITDKYVKMYDDLTVGEFFAMFVQNMKLKHSTKKRFDAAWLNLSSKDKIYDVNDLQQSKKYGKFAIKSIRMRNSMLARARQLKLNHQPFNN